MVPRAMLPIEVDEAMVSVKKAVKGFVGHENVEVMDSVSWHKEQFTTSGNWESWIWDTVTGKDYSTREPHFSGFLVYGERLGRANAAIVDLALRAKRAVLALKSSTSPIEIVQGVGVVDEGDMVAGWKVESSAPAEASG